MWFLFYKRLSVCKKWEDGERLPMDLQTSNLTCSSDSCGCDTVEMHYLSTAPPSVQRLYPKLYNPIWYGFRKKNALLIQEVTADPSSAKPSTFSFYNYFSVSFVLFANFCQILDNAG